MDDWTLETLITFDAEAAAESTRAEPSRRSMSANR